MFNFVCSFFTSKGFSFPEVGIISLYDISVIIENCRTMGYHVGLVGSGAIWTVDSLLAYEEDDFEVLQDNLPKSLPTKVSLQGFFSVGNTVRFLLELGVPRIL